MDHKKFSYRTAEDVQKECERLGVTLPFSSDISVLKTAVNICGKQVPNRILIQPMEGCDSDEATGTPSDLTVRRYERFAAGGAGTIWFEAVAVVPEGRANPRQLQINEKSLPVLAKLTERIKEISLKKYGFEPLIIMQGTHSGRQSRPEGKVSRPLIAQHKEIFEKNNPLPDSCIITDEDLKRTEEAYGAAARLAEKAGFDGIDVKNCHGYLNNELMTAYERKGEYGGCFENRTRFYFNSVEAAKSDSSGKFIVTSRMNVLDGYPYPWGIGEDSEGNEDLTESLKIIDILYNKYGFRFLDVTIGNPYFNPHVNRPYDNGGYVPPEHPFESVARMMGCVKKIQSSHPDMAVVGSGFSYMRQFSPNMAAGAINQGYCTLTGFGRMAFAYPGFANDIFTCGFDSSKTCLACGKCTELMRGDKQAGCVIRDSEVYLPIYRSINK